MKLGIIGLGRMGAGVAERVLKAGHEVIGFDLDQTNKDAASALGVQVVASLAEVATLSPVVWLMVPQGPIVDKVIQELLPHMQANSILIDGGNSNYLDSMRRAQMLATHAISYLDCGTSGGLLGRTQGYCLMIGGDKTAYDSINPLLSAIAAPNGCALVGPSGAGHYVKMVHNGIEYALLQGYAEGFHLIKDGSFKDAHLDLEKISNVWMHGSVIRSWLLDLAHDVFKEDQELTHVSGEIAEGGTGKWTVEDAHKTNVPVPLIEESLEIRRWSRESGGNYATKVIAMLRKGFGGHDVKKVK
ncbi:MAG: decarboxylating 6-phosphogluconate dehydrogenase [Candidatus Dependentiae bacterium]|nr:decarboxylating 6-phosphogluconate dehydrogenase [Candidatus Dependentiae bacterium]